MRLFLIIFLILLLRTISYTQNLSTGLVACYSFTGNANDGSGYGNHGTVSGGTLATDRFGSVESAYQFNGISSHIVIPSAPLIANKSFTFSVWANALTIPSYNQSATIISIGDPNTGTHWGITLTNNYASTKLTGWTCGGRNIGTPSGHGIFTNVLPPPNTWYHLTMVRSEVTVTLFVNGEKIVSEATGGIPAFFQDNNTVTYVGLRCNSTQPFKGIIDDVALYDRPLTDEEVQALYSQGIPCSTAPPPVVSPPVVQDTQRCGSGTVTLSASGGTTYRWYNSESGSNLLYEGNPFTTPTLSSSTEYFVTNFENGMESSRAKANVIIFPNPLLSCSFSDVGYVNTPISFTTSIQSGTPPFVYTFDFGDGSILNTTQSYSVYQFIGSGVYVVKVIATDANSCQSSCEKEIHIYEHLTPSPPSVTHEVQRCGSGEVTLSASGGTVYRWYDAQTGGNLVYEGNPFTTPTLSNSSEYFVTNFENGVESSRVKAVATILPTPLLDCSFPQDGFVNNSISFTSFIQSGIPPFTYIFDFGDGSVLNTPESHSVYQFNEEGIYSVTVIVADANNCLSSCEKEIDIHGELMIPNVITANNDVLNQTFTVFVKQDDAYQAYSTTEVFNLKIINRWGKEVYNTTNIERGWKGENAEGAGLYFYSITLGEKRFKGWVSLIK